MYEAPRSVLGPSEWLRVSCYYYYPPPYGNLPKKKLPDNTYVLEVFQRIHEERQTKLMSPHVGCAVLLPRAFRGRAGR